MLKPEDLRRMGWRTWEGPQHPVTGRFRASRHGVELCAGTEAQLLEMIAQAIKDRRDFANTKTA